MNSNINRAVTLIIGLGLLFGFTNKSEEKGILTISFNNLFNKQVLDFNTEYVNAHGEKIKLSTLNYFISNIKLTKKDGTVYTLPQDSSYFLVKESEPASKLLSLTNIPAGKYDRISFMVGVDSIRNTMDIEKRTGSLDVGSAAKGMYWVWNSGYIFFKMEGSSPSAPEKQKNRFAYHIGGFGGFKTPMINNIRTVNIAMKKLSVNSKQPAEVAIDVDVARLFDGGTPIRIAEKPSVMGGDVSGKIADNYISCFKLGKVSKVNHLAK